MSILLFTTLIFLTSVFAGLLGSLTGLGGGVVIVPALVLLFKVDLRYAIGASLVSVIATSSGAAAAYVKEGLSNIRIGMFLEIATTLGALLGAYLTAKVSTHSTPSCSAPCCSTPLMPHLAAELTTRWSARKAHSRLRSNSPAPTQLQPVLSAITHNTFLSVRNHVGCRHSLWPPWDRIRCGQGACDGSGDEAAVEGFNHHQQLHDLKHDERFFDALIVGQYEGADLIYKGKVRFGFDDAMKRRLLSVMEPFRVSECPFRNLPEPAPKRCRSIINR
jgi:hypothetical protein